MGGVLARDMISIGQFRGLGEAPCGRIHNYAACCAAEASAPSRSRKVLVSKQGVKNSDIVRKSPLPWENVSCRSRRSAHVLMIVARVLET